MKVYVLRHHIKPLHKDQHTQPQLCKQILIYNISMRLSFPSNFGKSLITAFVSEKAMESPISSRPERAFDEVGEETLTQDNPVMKSIPALFLGHSSMTVCKGCIGIDFNSLAQLPGYVSVQGRYIMDLGSTATLASSSCPLCRLFASVSPAQGHLDRKDIVHLRAIKAYQYITGTYFPAHPLRNTTLLGVVSISKQELENNILVESTIMQRMMAALRITGTLCVNSADHDQSLNALSIRYLHPSYFDFEIARYWQDYCRKNHSLTCGQMKQARPKSLRLIDCELGKIVQPKTRVDYAVLSYVWGEPGLRGITSITDDLNQDDLLSSLPKTVKDSMYVVRRLNLRYLWVDRYCIDQTDAEDQYHQIQQMDAIYRSAELTIIAAAGDGPDHGLPGANGVARINQENLHVGSHCIVQTLPHPSSLLSRSKWATRGW
jgi:hypothetical protein